VMRSWYRRVPSAATTAHRRLVPPRSTPIAYDCPGKIPRPRKPFGPNLFDTEGHRLDKMEHRSNRRRSQGRPLIPGFGGLRGGCLVTPFPLCSSRNLCVHLCRDEFEFEFEPSAPCRLCYTQGKCRTS